MMSHWIAFWDGPHSIYVNARHKEVHYRLVAEEIAALVPSPAARVLDYGSGEALRADLVAAAAGKLFLCEGAPRMRAGIAARFAGFSKICVIAPEDVERLRKHSLDLIMLHSVAQYLEPDETAVLFELFQRLLKSNGVLIVSDVIAPNVSVWTDAIALLRFGAANGFLVASIVGLTRTLLSDYRRLRSHFGITRFTEADMIQELNAAGFVTRRAAKNLGHNQTRMAFIAQPVSADCPD